MKPSIRPPSLLSRLFCKHDWIMKNVVNYLSVDDMDNNLPVSRNYIFTCKKCLKVKRFKMW